jgi:hypothetical protein
MSDRYNFRAKHLAIFAEKNKPMKNVILFASITMGSGLLMANIYNSLVDAQSWGSDIPRSIEMARNYFKSVNPGYFYRLFSPVNQVLGLLSLVVFWKTAPAVRLYLGVAFIMQVAADILTFAYFYPRNEIIFSSAPLTDIETLKQAWSEWNAMNWVRSSIALAGIVFSFVALHKIYTVKKGSFSTVKKGSFSLS